jgi:tetratricopeptide (TPR) repeat protein
MKMNRILAGVAVAGFVLGLTAMPATAWAQQGGVTGKVFDTEGKPAADVTIHVANPDNRTGYTFKTNAKGEYQGIGIPSAEYQIKATKGNMTGIIPRIAIGRGGPTLMPDIKMETGAAAAAAAKAATMTNAEKEAANKKNAAIKVATDAAVAAETAGNFDEAIRQLQTVATEMGDCDLCYMKIAEINMKKKDEAAAEAAYKKVIEIAPTKPDAYGALAAIYNGQKKFAEATAMGAKQTEMMTAGGGAADPIAFVNQGIILWNQSKVAEAKVLFEKAVKADAKNADAHYWFGMALVNEGKMAESAKEMQEYLTLAPTGQYADTAKAILSTVK